MTDPTPPTGPADDRDDRAARAFRDALRQHAEEPEFTPLESPTAGRRRAGLPRWVPVAAAVVLVAAVAIPLVIGQFRGSERSRVPAAAPAERAPADSATAQSRPTTPARSGWRWESYRVLSYQVPDYWGYGYAPRVDWCAGRTDRHPGPFVDLAPERRVVAAIACPRELPVEQLQTFVSVRPVDATDRGWELPVGWAVLSRELAGYLVEVVHTDALATVADQIIASVRPLADVDPNGCPARSALEVDPAGVAADPGPERVSLCQYDLGTSPAQLLASKPLDPEEGRAVTAALAKAPRGSGPDDASCTSPGDTGVLVRQWRGPDAAEVAVRYSGCRGNGIVDRATSRTLTRDACQAVLQPPLVFTTGHGRAGALCAPPARPAGPSATPTPSPSRS